MKPFYIASVAKMYRTEVGVVLLFSYSTVKILFYGCLLTSNSSIAYAIQTGLNGGEWVFKHIVGHVQFLKRSVQKVQSTNSGQKDTHSTFA